MPLYAFANSRRNPLTASASSPVLQRDLPARRYRRGGYLHAMTLPAHIGANTGPRYDGGGQSQRGAYG